MRRIFIDSQFSPAYTDRISRQVFINIISDSTCDFIGIKENCGGAHHA
jgi:hypothetical protein